MRKSVAPQNKIGTFSTTHSPTRLDFRSTASVEGSKANNRIELSAEATQQGNQWQKKN
jgi:hypothetical protein